VSDEFGLGRVFYELFRDNPYGVEGEGKGQEHYVGLGGMCSEGLAEVVGMLLRWDARERWTAGKALERVSWLLQN